MYVMHVHRCGCAEDQQRPMTHLEFKTRLCNYLLHGWPGWYGRQNIGLQHRPTMHMVSWTDVRWSCVLCGHRYITLIAINVVIDSCVGVCALALSCIMEPCLEHFGDTCQVLFHTLPILAP